MKIKKIIKYLFIVVFGLLIAIITARELFDNRPFKFEQYRLDEELEAVARVSFPIGSNVYDIENALKKSGAECNSYKSFSEDCEITIICDYYTSLISLRPLGEHYEIALCGDEGGKLIKLGARRISGLLM